MFQKRLFLSIAKKINKKNTIFSKKNVMFAIKYYVFDNTKKKYTKITP